MSLSGRGFAARAGAAAGAVVLSSALTLGAAQAQDKTFVMKITLATIGDSLHEFSKRYAAAVEKDSGGRIKAEVYPGSQLGSIPRQAEGVQFGAIQCEVVPPEFLVGIDERFELLAAPGLISSMEQGQRLAEDAQVRKLMLGIGANKGFHGVGLFMATTNDVVSKTPINHIADFKGKKIRVFASQFQTVPFGKLGVTPVAMTLGDVVPALQQGAIDGSLAGVPVLAAMHFKDAAKYITQIGQPAVFSIVEISKKWFDTLPPDLQQIIEKDATREAASMSQWSIDLNARSYKAWTDSGGEIIKLPPDELASLLQTLSSAGDEVSKSKPTISEAYQIVKEAAQRTK
jgi:TRAP-type C4-dicarboxylate transport system substrate-binding protein